MNFCGAPSSRTERERPENFAVLCLQGPEGSLTRLKRPSILQFMVPECLRSLFWDTNLDDFDPLAFPTYTIARILEYGDQDAVAWLKTTFSETQIVNVVRTERRLSRRSANFWALVYGVSADQVAALKLVS